MKRIWSKTKALEWPQDSPHYITLWELSVAMETRVLIRSGPKRNAAFSPHQNDATDKVWLQLALVAEIYMFESVNTQTD